MTPEQIKRAKRLAEILGIYDSALESMRSLESKHYEYARNVGAGSTSNPYRIKTFEEIFQPEQDKALLWDLQIKYEVIIDWWKDGTGFAYIENKEFTREWSVDFNDTSELPAALIDCVIEINGGYDE